MTNSKSIVRTSRHPGSKSVRSKSAGTKGMAAIVVRACAHTAEGANWHFVLEFNDRNGGHRQILIPCSTANHGMALFKVLSDSGYPVPADNGARRRLQQLVLEAKPKRSIVMVGRPGWHGSRFMLGKERAGTSGEDLILTPGLQ